MNDGQVREVSLSYRKNVFNNVKRNNEILIYYMSMIAAAVKSKAPQRDIASMTKRWKRLERCNQFWQIETYQASRVKVLLKTYLCHDKFCYNCKQVKQLVWTKRYLPLLENYRDSMYHITLTVPDCSGEHLPVTLRRMAQCMKRLVGYLYGDRQLKGLDLAGYGYQGCIRTLEITYNGNMYHPHYHIAAIFTNPAVVEDKCIDNQFSAYGTKQFSKFETILQRVWWLLINGQRLSYEAIFSETAEQESYSCTVDSFQPDDYKKLFSYMIKSHSMENEMMTMEQFQTLYHALNRVPQIQGYGVFYNIKAAVDSNDFSDQEYQEISDLIIPGDQPVRNNEPIGRLAKDSSYTMVRRKPKD